MRSLSGARHRPPIPTLHGDQNKFSTSKEKADALNAFFVKQTYLGGADRSPDLSSLSINVEDEFSTLATTPADVFGFCPLYLDIRPQDWTASPLTCSVKVPPL